MRILLVLLVAITMAYGVAASIAINLTPALADDSGNGY